MDIDQLRGYQEASRESALEEMWAKNVIYNPALIAVTEISEEAIDQYEDWRSEYDFGWERVLAWKSRPAHAVAIDIAVWYEGVLAGMCWASPKNSHEKVFVLYIQRNPDKRLPTRGFIAPLCLSAVRSYGLLLGMSYVVIDNPIPQAREAYEREGFVQLPGVGLAYDLAQDYDESTDEVLNYDA
ncbi:hypothetical protein [Pseudomonas sp. MWU16-30317]|uniref:hypothetical protein n=1 Tax=Pseudomonas sp. MWU16-30317 TaxID=2878095 RepID=UPI001CFC45F3|nr:hypothetical protein [Pseudomonas sp. MWU16-30317]